MKAPRVYAALDDEIHKADTEGVLSNSVKYAEAIQLPYLLAVCKEGM